MDKRTILAFVLIGIIIFGMPYYFRLVGGVPPVPESDRYEEDPVSRTETPADPASASRAEGDPSDRTPSIDARGSALTQSDAVAFEAQTLSVDTDLYTAVFSSRGGLLVSWHLKDHHDEQGYDLELLGRKASGLGVSIAGERFDDVEFVPDRTALTLHGDEQGSVTFRATSSGRTIVKKILFQGNRYRTEVELTLSGVPASTRVGLRWNGALAETEGENGASEGIYGVAGDMIVTMAGGEVEDWTADRLSGDDPLPSGRIAWVVVRNKYFLAGLIPSQDERHDLRMSGTPPPDAHFDAEVYAQYAGEPIRLGVYVGPLDYNALKRQNVSLYGEVAPVELTELVQFGWNFVRPILRPVTILITHALASLHNVIPNWGLVIVVFSILVKVVLFPLTRKSMEATAKMQEIQPQIAALREKLGSDQQKLNTEMMKLYKEQKVNPVGGCLPMLLQAPILFSLFNVFRNAIQLRQSEFILWIQDLSKPDSLTIAGFDLHVLPLLMAAAMFVQQKMTMKDPKQAALVYIMPVFMIWIFWSMSSGLVLYFTMYNLLSLFEQQVLKKAKAAAAES